ncbi:MAG TPA: DUF4397 domain-containing protein [Sphingobacteriaceae bacterium]
MYTHTINSYTVSRNPKIFVLLAAFLAFVVLISSCNDDDPIEGQAEVMIVNSASGSAAQDFYLDDTKVNAQAVAYSQNSGYISTQSGDNRKAEFKNTGTTTVNWSSNVDIDAGEKYTFFFTNSSSASSTTNSGLMLEDDTTPPPSGKARVRFVNLAQGYTAANLLVIGGATWATNTTFGTASGFMNIDPGTYSLQTNLASNLTGTVSLGNFTLQAGKIYTIYTRGVLNGSASTAVGASLIVHN